MKRLTKGERILLILAAVSLGISAVLAFGPFPGLKFGAVFLLIGAAALLVYAAVCHWGKTYPWVKTVQRILLGLFLLGCAYFLVLEVWIFSSIRTDRDTPVQAVVILGAGIRGEEPSISLKARLDTALSYLEEHPGVPVIVSGGQGADEIISEAECMARYLIRHGVAEERILREDASRNTMENMVNSKALLKTLGVGETQPVAVITSDYHICRAQYLWGEGMVPVSASLSAAFWPWTVNFFVREAFGLTKAFLYT